MALHLAEKKSRLPYSLIWKTEKSRGILLATWAFSLHLPRLQAKRVQYKMDRFFKTSFLLKPNRFIFRIESHRKEAVILTKQVLNQFRRELRDRGLSYLSLYIKHKTKIIKIKGPRLADKLKDNIKAARTFARGALEHLTENEKTRYESWADVSKSNIHWGIPLEHNEKDMRNHLHLQFRALRRHFGASSFFPNLAQ